MNYFTRSKYLKYSYIGDDILKKKKIKYDRDFYGFFILLYVILIIFFSEAGLEMLNEVIEEKLTYDKIPMNESVTTGTYYDKSIPSESSYYLYYEFKVNNMFYSNKTETTYSGFNYVKENETTLEVSYYKLDPFYNLPTKVFNENNRKYPIEYFKISVIIFCFAIVLLLIGFLIDTLYYIFITYSWKWQNANITDINSKMRIIYFENEHGEKLEFKTNDSSVGFNGKVTIIYKGSSFKLIKELGDLKIDMLNRTNLSLYAQKINNMEDE